jgi:hypothetical protein
LSYYFVDVLAKDPATTSVMSMLQIINFVSQPLTVIDLNGYAVPMEGNTDAVLNVHFKYASSIPKSLTNGDPLITNSEIRLYFVGIGSVFIKNDLGFGYLTPTQIPCMATTGLVPTTGQTVTCTVYPSTKPYIQVTNYNLVNPNTAIRMIIPKLTTPVDDFSVVIRILTSLNGVYNELANGNQAITLNPDANISSRL